MSSRHLFNAVNYCLVTFNTTHSALQSENTLTDLNIPFLTVPVPKEISAGCGLAIRYDYDYHPLVVQAVGNSGVIANSYYKVEKIDGKMYYTLI